MGDVCGGALILDAGGPEATRITGRHLGATIVISCAIGITPIELFLVEIWPRHGFFSLLLFVVPLIAAWAIARRLPERYYRVKSFETSGRLYEWLGIRYFKRVVPNGDCVNHRIRQSEPGYRLVRNGRSIVSFEARTRLAEQCHVGSLFLVLPSAVYALILGWDWFAFWLVVPNIPLHLYPVLLQRYTRARIQKVLERAHRAPTPR